jgi:hypothetical protein
MAELPATATPKKDPSDALDDVSKKVARYAGCLTLFSTVHVTIAATFALIRALNDDATWQQPLSR